MESFIASVKAQTFTLSSWDMIASFTNIPYIYYFKNPSSDPADDFMPSDRLRASFLSALEEFPIIAGHVIIDKQGRGLVKVNPHNLNMPEYLESQSSVHFRDLENARFSWNALPDNVVTIGTFPTRGPSGAIKLANINIVRLKENSGLILFASITHHTVDGVGYCAFVNRWAELCRSMQNGPAAERPTSCAFSFDRSIINSSMPDNKSPLNAAMTTMYDSPTYLGSFLSWISPETRGSVVTSVSKLLGATGHVFHISAASLGALREAICKCAPQTQRISDNDILTVLISHAIAKATKDSASYTNGDGYLASVARRAARAIMGEPDEFWTMVVLDIRPRISGLSQAQYTGNCVTCIPIVSKHGQLAKTDISPGDLAELCAHSRDSVKSATPETIAELNHVCNKCIASYGHAMAKGITTTNKVVVSNQSRFSLYQNDFGSGIPTWVSPIPVFYANFASILPVHPSSDGGYNLYLTVEKRVMANILQNNLWNSHVDLVY